MAGGMTMKVPAPRSTANALAIRTGAAPSRALASVRAPVGLIPQADAATDLSLRIMGNRLESLGGSRFAILGEFPDADRARLERRADDLADRLQPGASAEILRSVGMLRAMKGQVAVDQETREALMQAHLSMLGHVPAWAIEAVCQRFMRSRERFAPDAGELADACEEHLIPVRAELRRIEHILSAEVQDVPSAEDRAEVAKACQAFVAEMARAADPKAERPEVVGQADAVARAVAQAELAMMPTHDDAPAGSVETGEVAG